MSKWKKVIEELRCGVSVYDHLEKNIRLSAGFLTPQFISMQYSTVVDLTVASQHASILHLSFKHQLLEHCLTLIFKSESFKSVEATLS